MKNKAIFLDRDGVINKRLIGDYVKRIKEFKILPKVRDALIEFKRLGYLLIIISNQQGVGKGLMSEKDLERVHKYMMKRLTEIDDAYYCPALEGTSNCRKPQNGMILKAKKDWNIDLTKSWMIGDSESDIICGKRSGCKTIRIVENNNEKTSADFTAKDLFECIKIIKNE